METTGGTENYKNDIITVQPHDPSLANRRATKRISAFLVVSREINYSTQRKMLARALPCERKSERK